MDFKKLVVVFSALILCTACGSGFNSKSFSENLSSEVISSGDPEDGVLTPIAPGAKTPFDIAVSNKNRAQMKFDVQSIANSTWKMIGYIEDRTSPVAPPGAGTAPQYETVQTAVNESIFMGISATKKVSKLCFGGPCEQTLDQATIEVSASCHRTLMTADFEITTLFSGQGAVQTVLFKDQIDNSTNCIGDAGSASAIRTEFIQQTGVSTSTLPKVLATWDSYLYFGMNSGRIYIFVRQ